MATDQKVGGSNPLAHGYMNGGSIEYIGVSAVFMLIPFGVPAAKELWKGKGWGMWKGKARAEAGTLTNK